MTLPENEDQLLLLHNPRCSKSRQVKVLLEDRGVDFTERRYLDDPLDREELIELGRRLERPAHEWIRSGEAAFSEAGLSESSPEEHVLEAMEVHPILMERPILVRGQKARVGRPPEEILTIL